MVTPSYNSGEFIDRTMRCVLSEDYPKMEYFVADGESKDDSVKIIESHSARLSGWLSEKDTGASHAINKGLGRSTGEIMTWLNADDLWMPGVLKYVAAWFAGILRWIWSMGHRAGSGRQGQIRWGVGRCRVMMVR